MRVRNLCEFVKMGLWINLYDFYLCVYVVTYGAIKIYTVQIYVICT